MKTEEAFLRQSRHGTGKVKGYFFVRKVQVPEKRGRNEEKRGDKKWKK